ncbi:MAG: Eco57I restriction-modification methylase domain-containing protein [Flavobacteriaceae bacterium]|nr:Eco57I restriction-modification methylase domain-containing protein [Flavobacteriaceae bacterium]
MQQLKLQQALNPAYRKLKPNRKEVNSFIQALKDCLQSVEISDKNNESEEHIKSHLKSFFEATFYQDRYINTKDRIDLAIYLGKNAKSNIGVLMEAKRLSNKAEFPTPQNLNKKATQELLLYYLRERLDHQNNNIKQLIATNGKEWFLFKGEDFYTHFFKNKQLVKEYEAFRDGKKDSTNNELFYKEIASPFIEANQQDLPFVHLDFSEMNLDQLSDRKLNNLFKLFSPVHWLGERFGNDSNQLNKAFYNELLHIIGLTETKKGSKKLIQRLLEKERNEGSLLENAMEQIDFRDKLSQLKKPSQFGDTREERIFHLALDLCITWVNRILFLKLLEAQLIQYNRQLPDHKKRFSFLNIEKIENYDELDSLFFQVLAKKQSERHPRVQEKYADVPYLNSSLFEPTDHEQKGLFITELDNRREIPVFSKTKLKDGKGQSEKGNLHTLEYLFRFLDAYDFASDGEESIQEENKSLINASVLGLIFEKINGYKDGSFFTPGFITMYMCRETIRKAVVQKFSEAKQQDFADFDDLKSYCFHYYKKEDKAEFNQLVNSLKICDPAVGSGHFLVSALNEILAIKSELKILVDEEGLPLRADLSVVNDELVVTDESGNLFEYTPQFSQAGGTLGDAHRIQKALFHEKQTIIENCLFGVDINPNSVKICRLRLWVELLKHAYYKSATHELETLPNIDINIKAGNSLISRFDLDADLGKALKESKWNMGAYRDAVHTYRNAKNKDEKRAMMRLMKDIKSNFRSEIHANDPKKLRLEKAKGELFNMTQQTDLFEKTKAQQKAWKTKIDGLSKKVKKIETELQEIKNNKIYENAFEWRFEFPEVLDDEGNFVGFDAVIGNPPYLNIKDEFSFFKNRYQTSKCKDLYAFFFELSSKLMNYCGKHAFITPSSFMTNIGFISLRKYLLQFKIDKIVDLGENVFKDASVDSAIVIFENEIVPDCNIQCSDNMDEYWNIKKSVFTNFQNQVINIYINPIHLSLAIKIENDKRTFGDLIQISRGVEFGFKSEHVLNQQISGSEYPLVCGGDVKRYELNFQDKYIEYNPNDLKIYKSKDIYLKEKILVRRIGSNIISVFDDSGKFNVCDVYNVQLPNETIDDFNLKTINAILNSKLIDFYFKTIFKSVKKLFPKIAIQNIKKLPLAIYNGKLNQLISHKVSQILELKKEDSLDDVTSLDKEIDVLVYKLYGLTYEEVLVVDEGFEMTREAYGNLKIC